MLRAAAHREDACSGTETSLAVRVRKATNSERLGQPRRCRRELPRRRCVGKEPQLRHGVEIVGPKSWSWSPGADVQNCVEGPSQTGPQGLVMDCGTLITRKGSNYPWSAQVARCPFKALATKAMHMLSPLTVSTTRLASRLHGALLRGTFFSFARLVRCSPTPAPVILHGPSSTLAWSSWC